MWVLMERMLWASPSSSSEKRLFILPDTWCDGSHLSPSLSLTLCLQRELPCLRGSSGFGVCVLSRFSCVWLFVTPWAVACQAPLSMGFSRQGHWTGLACPSPGDLPNPGIKPTSLMSPALAGGFSWGIQPNKKKTWPTRGNKVMAPLVQSEELCRVSIAPESLWDRYPSSIGTPSALFYCPHTTQAFLGDCNNTASLRVFIS